MYIIQVIFKNKQITDFAIHISEKNELLEKIKIKLKEVKVINDTHKAVVKDPTFINTKWHFGLKESA